MLRHKLLFLITAFVAVVGLQAATIQAAQAADYGDTVSHSDFAGNGQIQLTYRHRTDADHGYYVESVKICADDGRSAYQGIAGKGLSITNENNVIKFSTGDTDLNPGHCRIWDLEIAMPQADIVQAQWLYTDVFNPGDNVSHCGQVTAHPHSWDSGC